MLGHKLQASYLARFFSSGFMGWPAHSSAFFCFLWFVSGRVLSSQPTKQ